MFILPPQGQRGRANWLITGASAVLITGLLFFTYHMYDSNPYAFTEKPQKHRPIGLGADMAEILPQLWKPYIHNINDTHFTATTGQKYELPSGGHRWTKPLGKKLLILDVDSRLDTGPDGIMSDSPVDYKTMLARTGGMLNHQLYALIHGYDYRFIRPADYKDRHGTWVKVPMIREALKTHDFVVFLDGDADFAQPQVPFEWLLSLWGITPETSLAMAEDPDSKTNQDDKGRVYWNTGFVVAQNSTRTHEILNAWDDCPSGKQWKGCEHWAHDWAHEQAAFGTYVRYDYADSLKAIPCQDGNGAPYLPEHLKCAGVFIRHHWLHKDNTNNDLKDMLLDLFVKRLHQQFAENKSQYFLDATNYDYEGGELHV